MNSLNYANLNISLFPLIIHKITVNLAPADLPKEGARFDLAIAIGILAASGQLPSADLHHYEFAGELALSGQIRGITGVLPFAAASHQHNKILVLPRENLSQACLVKEARLLPADHISEVFKHFCGQNPLPDCLPTPPVVSHSGSDDIIDVIGQSAAKRALEIAAAGGHHLL